MKPSILFRRCRPFRTGDIGEQRERSLRILFWIVPVWCLVLGLFGCRFGPSPSAGPPPTLSIATVQDLGVIPTNPDILGRDGGYSAAFQGYSVWLYGDTFLAKPNAQDFTLISDSWSYTSDFNAQNGITGFQQPLNSAGAPTMILPETPAEEAFNAAHNSNNCQEKPCGARWALWPSSIVVDPVAGHALVFYMLVYSLPGNFNFQAVGNSVATCRAFRNSHSVPPSTRQLWRVIPIFCSMRMSRVLARPR